MGLSYEIVQGTSKDLLPFESTQWRVSLMDVVRDVMDRGGGW